MIMVGVQLSFALSLRVVPQVTIGLFRPFSILESHHAHEVPSRFGVKGLRNLFLLLPLHRGQGRASLHMALVDIDY